jgi:signal transduction histidine kinase
MAHEAQIGLRSEGRRAILKWGFVPPAVLVALGYYLGAKVGFAFTLEPNPISTLWPPNAILLAALLVTPARIWWILIAAAFPAHLAAQLQSGVPLAMVLGWFASNCSEALIGAGAIRLMLRDRPRFHSLRDVGIVLLCAALLAPLVSTFLDAALVKLVGWGDATYWALVQKRLPSNMLAELTLVPFIATWAMYGGRAVRNASPALRLEAALVLAGLLVVCLLVFKRAAPSPALLYAPLPFLLWAAVRLGPLGTSTAIFVVTLTAIWGALQGAGPFAQSSSHETALSLQLFLIVVSLPLLLLSVAVDERSRNEAQVRDKDKQLAHLSRVAMLGSLSGALAHELNQPLTAILSNAQAAQHLLLRSRIDPQEFSEILGDIVAEDRRAGEVVRRLRAFFRRGEMEVETLAVDDLVRSALNIAEAELRMRDIAVDAPRPAGLPAVRGDRVQLEQVLLNLVLNACEALMARDVHSRRLVILAEAEGAHAVRLTVRDNGTGIARDRLEDIFEPFFTTKPLGLGLGLSISRSIVQAHGGRLWCAASSEAGSTFCVSLPSA